MESRMRITFFSLLGASLLVAALILVASRQKPKAPGQVAQYGDSLDKPRGLAVDAKDGLVYVTDSLHDRVQKRTLGGSVLGYIGHSGSGDGEFQQPCDVAVDAQGDLYVADTFFTTDPNNMPPWGKVEKFSPTGVFVASFGQGQAQGTLFGPRAIAVDKAGNVYLSDTGNCRILKYGPNGDFLTQWGKRGSGPGQFIEPFGLAFDKQGFLYVADRLNFRIQVFRADGSFVRQWKVDGWDQTQINMEPYLAIDQAHGWVYASDPTRNKVHRWDLRGRHEKIYTQSESGPLSLPTGLAVAPDGSLLVTNDGTNSVVTVKP